LSYNPQNGRRLEETVEPLFRFMGYSTRFTTVLHTRTAHIIAEMDFIKGKHRLLIECTEPSEELVGAYEVQKFCSRVALAKEKSGVDGGLLVSTAGFTPEAVSWCQKYCSFVHLRTYKQLMASSARFGKLLRKFLK
jgi:hypothetical protein